MALWRSHRHVTQNGRNDPRAAAWVPLKAWHVEESTLAGGLHGTADNVGSHRVAAADRSRGEAQLTPSARRGVNSPSGGDCRCSRAAARFVQRIRPRRCNISRSSETIKHAECTDRHTAVQHGSAGRALVGSVSELVGWGDRWQRCQRAS